MLIVSSWLLQTTLKPHHSFYTVLAGGLFSEFPNGGANGEEQEVGKCSGRGGGGDAVVGDTVAGACGNEQEVGEYGGTEFVVML